MLRQQAGLKVLVRLVLRSVAMAGADTARLMLSCILCGLRNRLMTMPSRRLVFFLTVALLTGLLPPEMTEGCQLLCDYSRTRRHHFEEAASTHSRCMCCGEV